MGSLRDEPILSEVEGLAKFRFMNPALSGIQRRDNLDFIAVLIFFVSSA